MYKTDRITCEREIPPPPPKKKCSFKFIFINTVLYKFIKDLNYGQHTVIQFDYYQASDCEIVVNYSDNRTNLDSIIM